MDQEKLNIANNSAYTIRDLKQTLENLRTHKTCGGDTVLGYHIDNFGRDAQAKIRSILKIELEANLKREELFFKEL